MVNDPLNSNMLIEKYLLKRLVYINSASHAYSEIMLDTHMALFGKNNAGKTASLAGTKLLLFPEVNFHRCDSKFKFKGKAGYYSMEESYDFYFPDARSFIILEVSNPEGIFCMVLYKTKNYGYGRFFIPVEYSQMRALFWDAEGQKFAEQISVSQVSHFAKQKGGMQLTDSKEIANLMFSGFRDTPDRKRFCALPLKDDRKESIDAFRNIYQLAFETGNLEIKTLPNAIAALLEMGRSRNEERLDANLIELSEQHTQLFNKGEWLQKLSNLKPYYNVAKNQHQKATDALNEYSTMYCSIQSSLDLAKKEHAPTYEKTNDAYLTKGSERGVLEKNIKQNDTEISEKKGETDFLIKQLSSKRDQQDKAKKLKASYGSLTLTEILDVLNEGLLNEKDKLDTLQTENGQIALLQKILSKRQLLQKEIADRREWISNSELILLRQLADVDAADILHTINPVFGEVAVKLGDADKNTILEFTRLFRKGDNGNLNLLGVSFNNTELNHFDLEQKRVDWKKECDEKAHEIDDLDSEIKQNKERRTKEELADLIGEIEQEVKGFESNILAISGIETLNADIFQLESELESNEAVTKGLKSKEAELKGDFSIINGEWVALRGRLEELKRKRGEFSQIQQYLDTAKQSTAPKVQGVELLCIDLLTPSYAADIIDKAFSYNNLFNDFKNKYTDLSKDLPHLDIEGHKELFALSDYDEPIRIYGSAFETLEYDFIQHKGAVQSHNQLFNNQISEIRESASLLRNFVSDINRDLNENNHISNLSAIKLQLTLHPAFLSLLSTLDKHDIQGDALLDQQLYDSLSKFVEKFFNKKSRRLKMADIISEMAYHYRLEETQELVTKGQSGGTTSAITSFVLAVLLKRVTPSYVRLQIPIIVDEISTLDSSNTNSTIKQITEHGFSIFCATPNYSASVSHKVGRWVMIDKSMIKVPLVQSCHLNILPDHVESFGEK